MPFDALPTDTRTSLFLERAMQRIADPKNWGRFRTKRLTLFRGTERFCLLGAIDAGCEGANTRCAAISILARTIDAKSSDPIGTIMNFNDSSMRHFLRGKQTRHREIMAVMKKAIEAAKIQTTCHW